jgi:hypothetical protein
MERGGDGLCERSCCILENIPISREPRVGYRLKFAEEKGIDPKQLSVSKLRRETQ